MKTQPGRIIAKEMAHIDEDDLVRVVLYITRRLTARLRITGAMYQGCATLDIKRALSNDRALTCAQAMVRRLRQRGGTE